MSSSVFLRLTLSLFFCYGLVAWYWMECELGRLQDGGGRERPQAEDDLKLLGRAAATQDN